MRLPRELEEKLFNYSISGVEKFSAEAYWQKGKTPLAMVLTEYFGELRSFYNAYLAMDLTSGSMKNLIKKKLDLLKSISTKYENKLADVMNAESVSLAYEYNSNAGCYSLAIDKNMINVEKDGKKERYSINKNFSKKISDIVETNNGYRFRNKKDIKLLFVFGFGFFQEGLTDDELVAIMLHEFGHSLQQMLVDAGLEIAIKEKRHVLRSLVSSIVAGFRYLPIMSGWDEREGATENELKEYTAYDRDDMAKELQEATKENITLMIKYRRKFLESGKPFPFVVKSIVSIMFGWVGVASHLIHLPFWFLIDKARWAFGFNKKFLSQNIRFEQFADYTAAQFGYGAELANALNKSHQFNQKADTVFSNHDVAIDFGAWNFIYFVPIVNVLLAYKGYRLIKNRAYLAGYPTTPERFAGVYKALEYELNNNKKITAEDKLAIQKDMEATKLAWEMSVDRKSPKFFIWNLYCKLTNRTIDSKAASANIEENVLIAFNEAERDYCRENNIKIDE